MKNALSSMVKEIKVGGEETGNVNVAVHSIRKIQLIIH